jgi:hypothetical protein
VTISNKSIFCATGYAKESAESVDEEQQQQLKRSTDITKEYISMIIRVKGREKRSSAL